MNAQRTNRKPLERPCTVCLSDVGEPCTVPTNTGRREIRWFHLDREYGPDPSEDSASSD